MTPPSDSGKTRKAVLFGAGDFASLVWACLTHDSPYDVAGFAVDGAQRRSERLHGLPVVPFEEVERHFPPAAHDLLIAVGPQRMNALRAERFAAGQAKGYAFASYFSSRARRWPDLETGPGCMVFDNAVIEPFVRIGANCVVRAGARVAHHGRLADHVFLAPGATLAGRCDVGARSFLGVNATLREATQIAEDCLVGAGAVVTRATEPGGLYLGVPAQRRGDAAAVEKWS